jgi:hypothetical protein
MVAKGTLNFNYANNEGLAGSITNLGLLVYMIENKVKQKKTKN